MARLRSLPVIFALAGLLLFALALWRATLDTVPAEEARAIARLEPVFGEVWLERNGRKEVVEDRRRALQRLDSIQTGAEGEALLGFASGEEIRLLENSLVMLDFEAGKPVLVIKGGDIWAERTKVAAATVLISRDGIRRTLAQDLRERTPVANAAAKKAAPRARPSGQVAASEEVNLKPKTKLETLTADYIQETLRTQRNLFFKCYAQLLQRTPGVSGEASLSFTIERTGRVSLADIASSNLQDPPFRRCLTDTMKRIEFKSFAGEPVNALFPVRFE